MTDPIFITKLLIDTALVAIIFMVQLAVYPSFSYFSKEQLLAWHKKYTKAITIIVGPSMIAQLGLSIYFVIARQQYLLGGIHLSLVLLVWISTAVQFVPIHNRITNNVYTEKDLEKLVNRNWVRVLLWVLIFGVSIVNYTIFTAFLR